LVHVKVCEQHQLPRSYRNSLLIINEEISIPFDEFTFDYVRSSGPGGQNVNKVNSKVILRWAVRKSGSLPFEVRERFVKRFARRINQEGILLVVSQRFRDRNRNVEDCLSKLRQWIWDVASPPKVRKATKPTRASQRRRLEEKNRIARKKDWRRGPTDD
jgi:ribosome-associated protein